jgi:hypothetical protein
MSDQEKNKKFIFIALWGKSGSENSMVPSESAPQELSNEWSCQQVATI